MRKNDAFVAKIEITRLTKKFIAIFALAERLQFLPPRFKVYHNFAASLQWSCVGIMLEFKAYFILVHGIHDTSLPTIIYHLII